MATITKITTSKGETRYRVRVVTGHKPDGTAIQQLRTFRTKREADTAGAKWEADLARGLVTADGGRQTLGAYLDEWMTRSARRGRP